MLGETAMKLHVADAFHQITGRQESPEIYVTFFPFAGLNHTIRIRDQRVYVRISDIMQDAPPQAHRALAFILVSKLYDKPVMAGHYELYRQYAYHPQIVEATDLVRQERGRKVLIDPIGKVYNLDAIFDRVNQRYFDNELTKPILSWSSGRSKHILGHYDYAHNVCVISRVLDHVSVPEFLVEFAVYFNMLRLKHRPQIIKRRRIYNTAAFDADVRRFELYYLAMEEWNKLARRR